MPSVALDRGAGRTFAGRAILSILFAFLALAGIFPNNLWANGYFAITLVVVAAAAAVTGYAARSQLRADPSLRGAVLAFVGFIVGIVVGIITLPTVFVYF